MDFIISDWDMPIINGVELLKMLKNDPKYFKIPFILLSPDKSISKNIYAMEEGAEHYSPIPFTEESLILSIESCINEQLSEGPEKTLLNDMIRNKLMKNYDKVIELASDLPNIERNQKALILTGESLFHTGQYDRAQEMLKHSLKDGNNSKLLDLLGRIHSKKGENTKSLECFEHAKKHNPLNTERNINLAIACFSQGMTRRALLLIETVLKSNPTYLDIVEISKLYLEHGYIERALDLLSPLEPITEVSEIFYNCTVKLWQIGKHKRCIEFLQNCIKKLPSCHLFIYHLGVIFLRQKKYERAKKLFARSLNMKPDYKPAQQFLSILGG